MNFFSLGAFFLSHFMRLTDRQTDGFTIAKTALHTMRCGKKWQLRCIATWGRRTPRQSLSASITAPTNNILATYGALQALYCIVLDAHVKVKVGRPIRFSFVAFYCWYVKLRYDLDLRSLTLNICNVCLWRAETLYRIWAQSSNPQPSIANLIFDLMTLNMCRLASDPLTLNLCRTSRKFATYFKFVKFNISIYGMQAF